MLEEFLGRQVTRPILDQGWVDVMIDVDRDTNGKAINERLKGQRSGGLPWMVILDADGTEIVSSNVQEPGSKRDGRNVGGPVADWECAWFVEMLRRSAGNRVNGAQLRAVRDDLEAFAGERRRAQEAARNERYARVALTSAKTIADAIKMYYTLNGRIPAKLEDLVNGGPNGAGRNYLEKLVPDPWGQAFVLKGDSSKTFEVVSAGPDGKVGTADDISSRRKPR